MEERQQLDLGLLEEIRTGIEYTAPELSDYLMITELSRVTHLKPGRIHYAIRYGKHRPLYGIKRGDRWFIHRLDALTWAAEVANEQQARWQRQAQRLGKLVRGEQVRQGILPPEQRKPRDPLQRAPKGIATYTYSEAARILGLTSLTLGVYVSKGQPLEGIARYRMEDGRVGLSARDVNAEALARKQRAEDEAERKRLLAEARGKVISIDRGAA